MPTLNDICALFAREGLVENPERTAFYLETVFRRVKFSGSRVLDVGCGAGLSSCYAIARGAAHVVAIDPGVNGGQRGDAESATKIITALDLSERIDRRSDYLQHFRSDRPFDVIILHNVINHLDEEACVRLRENVENVEARAAYRTLLQRVADLSHASTQLFVSDCSPDNVFARFGRRNPFTPNIYWRMHQPPEVWVALLEEVGFGSAKIGWTPVNRFYRAGRALTGNRLVSYFTTSHFHFTMSRR